MNWKRHFAEAATLVAAACLCAIVANALSARERKLALPGSYPNATTVPAPPSPTPASPAAETGARPSEAAVGPAPAAPTPSDAALPAPKVAPAATPVPRTKTPAPGGAAPAASPAPAGAARLTDRFPPHPDKPFVEVAGNDVAFLREGGALVLDARRSSVYQEGHIAGALSFPIWEADVDRKIEALVGEGRDPKQPIVLYCAGGDCEDSHMLAQKLFGAGFENLLVYRDGWPDWVRRGGASRTGPQP